MVDDFSNKTRLGDGIQMEVRKIKRVVNCNQKENDQLRYINLIKIQYKVLSTQNTAVPRASMFLFSNTIYASEYMKVHIFELRRMLRRYD